MSSLTDPARSEVAGERIARLRESAYRRASSKYYGTVRPVFETFLAAAGLKLFFV